MGLKFMVTMVFLQAGRAGRLIVQETERRQSAMFLAHVRTFPSFGAALDLAGHTPKGFVPLLLEDGKQMVTVEVVVLQNLENMFMPLGDIMYIAKLSCGMVNCSLDQSFPVYWGEL